MSALRFFRVSIAITLVLASTSWGEQPDTSPTVSGDLPVEGIWTSLISVGVIPEASDTIHITATDETGDTVAWSASSDDTSIARVEWLDSSSVKVIGVDFGSTTLTISSASLSQKQIPVQVYNHTVLDVGELQITYVDSFVQRMQIYKDSYHHASFYHPAVPAGWHALGTWGGPETHSWDMSGRYAVMIVKQTPGSDALMPPDSFRAIWYSGNPYDGANHKCVYQPIPPKGYKAMGMVVATSDVMPGKDEVVCIREDLTAPGSAGDFIWNSFIKTDHNFGDRQLGCFQIDPPLALSHDDGMAYLHTGTFVGWNKDYNIGPVAHEVMNVLKVKLPLLAEAPEQHYIPKLESYDEPPDYTLPLVSKVMLVPCSIVNDRTYANNTGWRVANSPFYRLERQVYYRCFDHQINRTSVEQSYDEHWTAGVQTSESEEYWNETSVSVTVECGVSIKFFSAKASGTFSKTFGYKSQSAVTELRETTKSPSLTTPAGKAAAIWVKCDRFVLKRHNGSRLEVVDAWEIERDSYVTDEYP